MYFWTRPQLPESRQAHWIKFGIGLIFLSFCMMWLAAGTITGSGSFDGASVAALVSWFSYGCLLLGVIAVSVGAVVNELRQSAFEAALRAGEAVRIKPRSPPNSGSANAIEKGTVV